MEKKLEVRDLRISFKTNNGTVKAVRDISFDLYKGETLAIVGESGSGKSVTARAVMGILAGNAIVENGEIIYDGKDLLKIDEESFHTLRGNKLSMIFQDPLSSLNPIVRIGTQLTEAMLLNNRERRKDARKQFNGKLRLLEKQIAAAKGNSQQARDKAKRDAKIFNDFVVAGVKLEKKFDIAKEAVVESLDALDALDIELIGNDAKAVRDRLKAVVRSTRDVHNDFVIPQGDAAFQEKRALFGELAKRYAAKDCEKLKAESASLRLILTDALDKPVPNYFCIGFMLTHGVQESDLKGRNVPELNAQARKMADEQFLLAFIEDVKQALAYSHENALKEQAEAVDALKKALAVYQKDKLDKKECKSTAKIAAKEVEDVIDYLSIQKDNLSYIFRTSLNSAIDKYFRSLVNNPKEEKRVARDTVKFNKAVAAGKVTAAVVPPVIIDGDAAHANMIKTVQDLITQYGSVDAEKEARRDYDALAVEMIDYLKQQASDYAYRLSQGMARHRAIELMAEVGITEPHKRYRQYPFEFSGGMRQRIVIAIALAANPDILICDEPTTALDVTIQAQILELINKLREQRQLSVIFITHDLGVVANMADRIAVMYAGKIVEYGTVDDVFYQPSHPYTWALLSSMPDLETKEKLEAIPGTPPNMIVPPKGDAFALRNKYAMDIDFEQQPPFFRVSDTHYAATWLLHPAAPKVEPPAIVRERIERMNTKEARANAD